jgi:hypothetical protein
MGELFSKSQHGFPADICPGLSLHKKLFNAHIEAKDHQECFERFSNLQLKDVPEWERMTKAWEKDHKQPNPYTVTKSGGDSLNS